MAKLVGIKQNSISRIISGARTPFDPRTTEEVCNTRDPENHRAREKGMRTRLWQEREAEKHQHQAAE